MALAPTSAAPAGPSRTTDARHAEKLSDTRARSRLSSAGAESQTRKSTAMTRRVRVSMPSYEEVARTVAALATTAAT